MLRPIRQALGNLLLALILLTLVLLLGLILLLSLILLALVLLALVLLAFHVRSPSHAFRPLTALQIARASRGL